MNTRKINIFGKDYIVFAEKCCGNSDKRTLYVEATKLCNAKCSFCSAGKANNGDPYSNILDLYNFRRVIDQLMYKEVIDSVSITGGEPFVNPHLYDIFRILDSYEIPYAVTTNGSLIDYYYDSIIDSNLKYLNISRNHYDASKNDELFGIDIRYNLTRLLKEFKGSIRFNCILTGEMNSMDSIENYVSMTSANGVKNILFIEDYFNPNEIDNTIKEFLDRFPITNMKKSNKCQCVDTVMHDIHIEFRKINQEVEEHNEESHGFIRNFVYRSNQLYGGWSDKSIKIY